MAGYAGDAQDVADEPESLRMLERNVQGVETTFEHGKDRGVRVGVARQQDRHPAAEGKDRRQVQGQPRPKNERTGDPPIEPDHGQQQDRPDYVQGSSDVDRQLGVGGAEECDRDLDGKRCQQQFDVTDPKLAQPPDVAADQDGDGQRCRDDREEEKHWLAEDRRLDRRRGRSKTGLPQVPEGEPENAGANEEDPGDHEHERRPEAFGQRTRQRHTGE